ncbi:MAG: hypothetical protein KJZ47_00955, partial [Gemmatimonadales bacterium]|nr:hypothetical protein [Gemmatimonadales bacterium]
LGKRHPGIALALTIAMLSLLGFPGTFGFMGKWSILSALVDRSGSLLAVILVLTSLVSAGYYLPVVSALWMKPGPDGALPPEAAPGRTRHDRDRDHRGRDPWDLARARPRLGRYHGPDGRVGRGGPPGSRQPLNGSCREGS